MKQIYSKILLLMTMILVGGTAWANPGDEITSPDDVVSGKSYYIKGLYTSSGTVKACYYAPTDDKANFKVSTAAVASVNDAMPITFTKVEGGWTLKTPKGNYVRPHTSNGQSYLVADPVVMQLTKGKTKNSDAIKIGAYSDYYLQSNTSGAKIGAYKATQNDVTLVEAADASSAVAVTGVALDKTEASLFVGATAQLKATVSPTDATNKKVTWSSNTQTVAIVDANGLVTAMAVGTATITATTDDGAKTATCVVTVAEPQKTGVVYKKVTSPLEDWTGKYLVVYEGDNVALNAALGKGVDVARNTVPVTISDGVIEGNELIDAAVVDVAALEDVEGAYSIGIADGYFIGMSSYANGLKYNTKSTTYNNYFAYNSTKGCIEISTPYKDGSVYLNFNANVSDKRFRYYKDASQKIIQLYQYVEAPAFDISIIEDEIAKAKEILDNAAGYIGVNVFMYSQGAYDKLSQAITYAENRVKVLETELEMYDEIDQLRKAIREFKPIFRGVNADYAIKHVESGLYLHIDEDGVSLAKEPTPINFHNILLEPQMYIDQYESDGFLTVHSTYLYNTPERKYLGAAWEEVQDDSSEDPWTDLVLKNDKLDQWFIIVNDDNRYAILTREEYKTENGTSYEYQSLHAYPVCDEDTGELITYEPYVWFMYLDPFEWFIEDYVAPTFDVPAEKEGEYAEEATSIANASSKATPVAYFSADGAQLKSAQKGLNIVKMSDNSVRKIIVK